MSRRINLVPPSERVRTTTDFGKLITGVVIVLVLFGVGITYYLMNNQLSNKESELADIRHQVEQLKSQTTALERYARLDQERQRVEDTVQEAFAGRTLVATLLDQLSLVTPEVAWFSSVELQTGDPVAMTGAAGASGAEEGPPMGRMSISGYTYSYEEVADMMVRLKLVSIIHGVQLSIAHSSTTQAVDPDAEVIEFAITSTLLNDQSPDTPLPISQAEVVFE